MKIKILTVSGKIFEEEVDKMEFSKFDPYYEGTFIQIGNSIFPLSRIEAIWAE